jgi:hypothetical protein
MVARLRANQFRALLSLMVVGVGIGLVWPRLRPQLRTSKGYGPPTLRDYLALVIMAVRRIVELPSSPREKSSTGADAPLT